MKKVKSQITLVLGICLVAVSFCLIAANLVCTYIAANKSQSAAEEIEKLLPERSAGVLGNYADPNMPIFQINGTDYVALLEIPSLNIILPIKDKWNGTALIASPARFCGSAYDNTLVIGGADNSRQFSFCDEIENGTSVIVTDMTGTYFTYIVERVDRSDKAESKWLTETEYDLTLYCRCAYSMDYIAVRCNSIYG